MVGLIRWLTLVHWISHLWTCTRWAANYRLDQMRLVNSRTILEPPFVDFKAHNALDCITNGPYPTHLGLNKVKFVPVVVPKQSLGPYTAVIIHHLFTPKFSKITKTNNCPT